MTILCRLVSSRSAVQRRTVTLRWLFRTYSDKPDKPHTKTTQKQIMVQGSASEDRMRVRRARPADVPRVLRFVQERASTMWGTSSSTNPAVAQLVLKDYVARALAQGHSLVAEQLESKKGWTHIRGVAVSSGVCPWDAALLKRWSQCVLCPAGKKLLNVAAISLAGPALHDKYRVQNILQVILIVPSDHPKCDEIILNLLKHSIERGQEVGFPLIRFDVTNPAVAKILEDMHLKKEWELKLDSSPPQAEMKIDNNKQDKNFISVYTVKANLTGKNFDK